MISAAGPPRQIVAAWNDGHFELVASRMLLEELRDVLDRPRLRRWVSSATAANFVDGLAEDAEVIDDPPAQPGLSPDPDDDYLIALARAARADYVVSGDRHLLDPIPIRPCSRPAGSWTGTAHDCAAHPDHAAAVRVTEVSTCAVVPAYGAGPCIVPVSAAHICAPIS